MLTTHLDYPRGIDEREPETLSDEFSLGRLCLPSGRDRWHPVIGVGNRGSFLLEGSIRQANAKGARPVRHQARWVGQSCYCRGSRQLGNLRRLAADHPPQRYRRRVRSTSSPSSLLNVEKRPSVPTSMTCLCKSAAGEGNGPVQLVQSAVPRSGRSRRRSS